MTTDKVNQISYDAEALNCAKPLSKRRKVFAKAFGIPGLICAIISMWFTITQSFVAITASGTAEVIAKTVFRISLIEFMNIPMIAIGCTSVIWSIMGIVMCVLSRFLGTITKMNHAGFVLSIVSAVCASSLSVFSIVYMILS